MREKRERQVIVKRFTYGKAPHFVTKHGALLKYGVNRPRNYGLASQGSLLPSFGCRLTQTKLQTVHWATCLGFARLGIIGFFMSKAAM